MPPLRRRKSDILLLARHFISKHSERGNRKVFGLSKPAQNILLNYDWFGNVRELENVIERAVVLGSTELILPEDLPDEIVGSQLPETEADVPDYHQRLQAAKRKIVVSALENSAGNYTEAARDLGIHPNNLHRLIRNLGIKNEIKN